MFEALHPHSRGGVAHPGEDGGKPFERPIERGLIACLAQSPRKVVTGQHQIGDTLHDLVE